MSDEETLTAAIQNVVDEHTAVPDRCPWCGKSATWVSKHAAKAHPDEWQEWKDEHTQVTVAREVWVDAE